ncbi:hypothetical protein K501DRAFT_232561 [Backusella circina FSU 941]|nr:hypothetical protein K501DRAFT_232561 [Backusella circina FSU 941]
MGKLQDNLYINEEKTPQEQLQAEFCPPLDSSLVEAIWNDTFDYTISHDILTTLAEQAEYTLDEQDHYFENASSSGCDESTTATTLSATLSAIQLEPNTEEENIQFLLTCFPTLDLDELKQALNEHDNDVERATDHLLFREFMQDDEDECMDISKLKHKQDQDSQAFFTNMEQEKKSKHNKKHKNKQKILPSTTAEGDDEKRLSLSVEKLRRYFPKISTTTIQHIVKQYNGAILPSVKCIMEKEPDAEPESQIRDWDSLKAVVQVKAALETVMVEQTEDTIYRVAVATVIQEEQKSVEHMIQIAIDYFLSSSNSKEMPDWTVVPQKPKIVLKQQQQQPKNKKELPVIPDYLLLNNQHEYTEDDPFYCRERANDLILERNELYRKAAASFRRSKNKGPGETGVAYFYSDSARKLDEQAKGWNMRAAKATVRQQRIKHNDDHLLDFHGLTVAEARVLLVEGITQWWSRSEMQSSRQSIQPLIIVTGAGNHSQGQSKLLPMTLKYLKSQGWIYMMPNQGRIIVKGLAK